MGREPGLGKARGTAFWTFSVLLMLIPGVVLLVGGIIANALGSGVESTNEVNEGDQDGDGRVDEDDYGDADHSEQDATQVSGPQELANPADDDADGRTDEDPAYRRDVDAASAAVADFGIAAAALGGLIVIAFGFSVWRHNARVHELRLEKLKQAAIGPPVPGGAATKK